MSIRAASDALGCGHGLCSYVFPPDKLFFYKPYVCVSKERRPRLSQLVPDLEACYDHPKVLMLYLVTNAEEIKTATISLRALALGSVYLSA